MTDFFRAIPAKTKIDHTKSQELFATFSFFPPAMETDKRPPLDIGVALDISTSMSGQKIEDAKKSVLKLIEHMKDQDRLTLVTFDSEIEVVFKPTKLESKDDRDKLIQKVSGIRVRGCTNLSGGLFKTLDLMNNAKPLDGGLRKCLIFTDGQANRGVCNPQELIPLVVEHRQRIGISAFGYGRDYNEDLLKEIAASGALYHIDSPDKILTAFGTELGSLVSTYAQNLELRLVPGEGVEIDEVLNDLTVDTEEGTKNLIVQCHDLLAEQEYHIVLRLTVDERKNTHPRDTALVHGTAKFLNVATGKLEELVEALKVRFVKAADADKEDNPKVTHEVALQISIQSQEQAIQMADAGDFAGARHIMDGAAVYARGVGAVEVEEMSKGVVREHFINPQTYKASGRKMTAGIRNVMKRRTGATGQQVGGVDLNKLYASSHQKGMAANFTEDSPSVDVPADTSAKKKAKKKGASKKRSQSSW